MLKTQGKGALSFLIPVIIPSSLAIIGAAKLKEIKIW